jgi:hypothetical protein
MARTGLMNNTKWEEVRLAMYGLGALAPAWRICNVETGYISPWDREWFYHFSAGGYDVVEWLEVRVTSREQDAAVLAALASIHVPGERIDGGFRVYGYVPLGKPVEYLNAV